MNRLEYRQSQPPQEKSLKWHFALAAVVLVCLALALWLAQLSGIPQRIVQYILS